MDSTDVSERFRSEYKYDLRDPDEKFTSSQFDRVERQILIWSLHEQVPCGVVRTESGFTVTVWYGLRDDGDVYRQGLDGHLRRGIFLELISDNISLIYIGE